MRRPPIEYQRAHVEGLQANPKRAKARAERTAVARAWRKRERQAGKREVETMREEGRR